MLYVKIKLKDVSTFLYIKIIKALKLLKMSPFSHIKIIGILNEEVSSNLTERDLKNAKDEHKLKTIAKPPNAQIQ